MTPWRLTPTPVFGGYQLRWSRWIRLAEGWDLDDGAAASPDLFPDLAAAILAAWDVLQLAPERDSGPFPPSGMTSGQPGSP